MDMNDQSTNNKTQSLKQKRNLPALCDLCLTLPSLLIHGTDPLSRNILMNALITAAANSSATVVVADIDGTLRSFEKNTVGIRYHGLFPTSCTAMRTAFQLADQRTVTMAKAGDTISKEKPYYLFISNLPMLLTGESMKSTLHRTLLRARQTNVRIIAFSDLPPHDKMIQIRSYFPEFLFIGGANKYMMSELNRGDTRAKFDGLVCYYPSIDGYVRYELAENPHQ